MGSHYWPVRGFLLDEGLVLLLALLQSAGVKDLSGGGGGCENGGLASCFLFLFLFAAMIFYSGSASFQNSDNVQTLSFYGSWGTAQRRRPMLETDQQELEHKGGVWTLHVPGIIWAQQLLPNSGSNSNSNSHRPSRARSSPPPKANSRHYSRRPAASSTPPLRPVWVKLMVLFGLWPDISQLLHHRFRFGGKAQTFHQ